MNCKLYLKFNLEYICIELTLNIGVICTWIYILIVESIVWNLYIYSEIGICFYNHLFGTYDTMNSSQRELPIEIKTTAILEISR